MNGIAEGIEYGRHFLVDAGIVPPDIGHGQRDEGRKHSRPVDAEPQGERAERWRHPVKQLRQPSPLTVSPG